MKDRRTFIRNLGFAGAALSLSSFTPAKLREIERHITDIRIDNPLEKVKDEAFWAQIREMFSVSSSFVNLNNAGLCPQPDEVQQAFTNFHHLSNEIPTLMRWRILDKEIEPIRKQIAELLGGNYWGTALCRNATEAMETMIFGYPLKAGDEVVLGTYDYPNMLHAWRQREKRDGIKLKYVTPKFPVEDPQQLTELYLDACSGKTKLIHLTHMINWTGQIVPVKEISAAAHQEGIEVMVDAAQTFGHIPFDVNDLDCDYLGTSLHKWICAPSGTGAFWMKQDHISKIWPLFGHPEPESNAIAKFEAVGAKSYPTLHAIPPALNFHEMIGGDLKAQRLKYLSNYLREGMQDIPGIKFITPSNDELHGAILVFRLEGQDHQQVLSRLMSEHSIHAVRVAWEELDGIRFSPNIYNLTSELDQAINGLKDILN